MAAPTTLDRLLGGRVLLEQPARGFRASVDAVLLAAAVVAEPGAAVLDAGCGTGAASLCLACRRADVAVLGIEVDPATAALAAANARRNGLADRVGIEVGDLLAPPPGRKGQPCAAVMTNPPFNPPGGRGPKVADRARAMVEAATTADWLAACLERLSTGGRLCLVHRADRLPAVLAALEGPTGAIEILPLWPAAGGQSAKRVLVRCRKGARSPAVLRQGLVLHTPTGMFTEAAEAILRHGAALDDVLPAG
jgi:tRNA1(Val) A37 N6-methylase TrmN6